MPGGVGAFVAFNDWPKLSQRSQRFATNKVNEAIDACVTIARKIVHVRTGELRDSIHGEAAENSAGLITGYVVADAPHAIFEENRPGHAFLGPAAAQVQNKFLNGCQDDFEDGLLRGG